MPVIEHKIIGNIDVRRIMPEDDATSRILVYYIVVYFYVAYLHIYSLNPRASVCIITNAFNLIRNDDHICRLLVGSDENSSTAIARACRLDVVYVIARNENVRAPAVDPAKAL